MRSYLIVMVAIVLSGCIGARATTEEEQLMSSVSVDGFHISLSGPESLPLSVVKRSSPHYDAPQNFFKVVIRNDDRRERTLPFPEISRNTILTYRVATTGKELVDNRVPPPRLDGEVRKLQPGEFASYQVIFEYPEDLLGLHRGEAALIFCVKWESSWLRTTSYAPLSYNWNRAFQLCRELRILKE